MVVPGGGRPLTSAPVTASSASGAHALESATMIVIVAETRDREDEIGACDDMARPGCKGEASTVVRA